jgi:hypothetical protein
MMDDDQTPQEVWRQTWPRHRQRWQQALAAVVAEIERQTPLRAASGIEVVVPPGDPELWVVYGEFTTNLPRDSFEDLADNTAFLSDLLYDWVVEEVWRLTGKGHQYPGFG